MSWVTGDDSQDLCGVEKLFHSLWKEIAGRALCLRSVPSHRESRGSGWNSLMGDRQPDPVCCWLISAGRVRAGSVGKSAQGRCACGGVCGRQTRRGDGSIAVSSTRVRPGEVSRSPSGYERHRVCSAALGGLLSASQRPATAR